MKIKNIIILGGIAFAIYYLTKKKSSTITANSIPDDADKDLTDVSNGDEPQSLSADDKLKLFKQANSYYRGGARPSRQLLADFSVRRYKAELRLKELGLFEKFKEWKKIEDKKNKGMGVPMGRPDTIIHRLPPQESFDRVIKLGRPELTHQRIIREKMPLPRYRTYGVNTLGLANEPIMAV